jgi:hypothetical protein
VERTPGWRREDKALILPEWARLEAFFELLDLVALSASIANAGSATVRRDRRVFGSTRLKAPLTRCMDPVTASVPRARTSRPSVAGQRKQRA